MSCGYQGYEFGAGYLDSTCIDGWLFDADNCDSEGYLYGNMGDYPCPGCQPLVAMDHYADGWVTDVDERWPRYSAWHLVMDIRRNRGLRTMPFVVWIVYRFWFEATRSLRRWWFRRRVRG